MNPGPGELWDRLGVLGMKVFSGKRRGLNTEEWEKEEYEILQVLSTRCVQDEAQALANELKAVNKVIWVGIDDLRDLQKKNPDLNASSEPQLREIARLGLHIMEMNDVRAKIIGQINELYGIKRPEKIPSSSGDQPNAG